MLALIVDGKKIACPLEELPKWTGARYCPHIRFLEERIEKKVLQKGEKYKDEADAIHQRWLGTYFRSEILHPPLAPFALHWIGREMGWGLFAAAPLKKGAFVATYGGVVRKRRRTDEKNSYCFQYLLPPASSTSLLIDGKEEGSLGRYLNHRSEGNVTSASVLCDGVFHILLHTTRPIEPGEELCYDYGPDYWKKRPAPQELRFL